MTGDVSRDDADDPVEVVEHGDEKAVGHGIFTVGMVVRYFQSERLVRERDLAIKDVLKYRSESRVDFCTIHDLSLSFDLDVVVLRFVAARNIQLPDGIALRVLGDFCEALRLVELAHHAVLRGGIVEATNEPHTPRPRRRDHFVHHRELHVALEDAAGHEPQHEFQHVAFHFSDGDRDHAVVAEAVLEFPVARDERGIRRRPFNLLLRITSRGEVELVGLVRELRDPGHVDGLERTDRRHHLQRVEVRPVVGKTALQLCALGVLAVHRVPLEVIAGELDRLKPAAALRHGLFIFDGQPVRKFRQAGRGTGGRQDADGQAKAQDQGEEQFHGGNLLPVQSEQIYYMPPGNG